MRLLPRERAPKPGDRPLWQGTRARIDLFGRVAKDEDETLGVAGFASYPLSTDGLLSFEAKGSAEVCPMRVFMRQLAEDMSPGPTAWLRQRCSC